MCPQKVTIGEWTYTMENGAKNGPAVRKMGDDFFEYVSYVDDKRQGQCVWYFNDELINESTYKDDKLDGWNKHRQPGAKNWTSYYFYVNGLKQGKATIYNFYGHLEMIIHFKDDLRDGLYERWDSTPNYEKLESLNYKNGKLHGRCQKWSAYRQHEKYEDRMYENGKPV